MWPVPGAVISSGSVSPPSCVSAAAVSSRNSVPRRTSKRAIRTGLPTSSQINSAISFAAFLSAPAAAFSHAIRWCVGCLRFAPKAADAAATARSTPASPDSAIVPIDARSAAQSARVAAGRIARGRLAVNKIGEVGEGSVDHVSGDFAVAGSACWQGTAPADGRPS